MALSAITESITSEIASRLDLPYLKNSIASSASSFEDGSRIMLASLAAALPLGFATLEDVDAKLKE
jgi:hypothetical protein